MISTDVFTLTNPALGSLILWSFLQGYEGNDKNGCPFPLLFLPLPLVLSQSIRDEFQGTNAGTGLYTWLTRKQGVLINLDTRIKKASNFTRNSIIFGCSNDIIVIQENGLVRSNNKGIKKGNLSSLSEEIRDMIHVSKKLGNWFSQINSTSNILNSVGLTL